MSVKKIDFTISFKEPQAHYVEIDMLLSGMQSERLDLKMPTWTPGSYLIREFSRHVEQLTATDENQVVIPVTKIAKNTWRLVASSDSITVRYRVYSFEKTVRTNFVDDSHAFISPAATFLYPDGGLHMSASVTVELPEAWGKISTGLSPISDQPHTFLAENFDILYDSPLELGNQDTWQIEAAGVIHEVAMVGKASYERDRLSEDIRKIVEAETEIWGSNPNDRYVFVTHHYQNAHGGLEHLNSTVLAISRDIYSSKVGYNNYLSLVAHEYFHLWHVKRLRPDTLGPFDYENENYTRLLWIFEGFTAYYDNLITRRCGFRDETEYLQELAADFNIVLNRPGHQSQSAGLASFDAWIKHYRPDENAINSSISYYNKGAMLAAMLDIYIITNTDGQYRLDQVLQAAYKKFYMIENRGITESDFLGLAAEVTGVSVKEICHAAHQTTDLNYNTYFNAVGYQLIDDNAEVRTPALGIKCTVSDGRTIIKSIERNSSAWEHGLNVEDEIIAVNDRRVDASGRELEAMLQQNQIGDWVRVLVARDGLIREFTVCLKESRKVAYRIIRNPNRTAQEARLGAIWLSLDKA